MAGSLPILIAQSSSVPLQWLDVLVVAVSVIGVTAFGMWIGRKEKNTGDYFLAGKTVAWWAVAGSIFGTNISSPTVASGPTFESSRRILSVVPPGDR